MALRGTLMGWLTGASQTEIDLAASSGCKWVKYGTEWPWLLNTPAQHTSGWNTAAVNALTADITRAHTAGLRVALVIQGVPTSINAAANSGDGGWHYFPTDAAGRTAMATAYSYIAGLLDAAQDYALIFNEPNNIYDFNKGNQTPAVVGAALAAVITKLRTDRPTLKIVGAQVCSVGDMDNPADDDYTMGNWGDQMLAANPTLLTSAKPDWWGVHPYTWADGMNGDNDPLGSQGWNGHRQADDWRTKLAARGATNTGLVICEFGEPSTPLPDFTETWQQSHAVNDYSAIDFRRGDGRYTGPELRTKLRDDSASVDAGHEFGAYRLDGSSKPVAWNVAWRASQDLNALAPGAAFNITPNPVAPGSPASFIDVSTNTPTGWHWTFGDGASADTQHASHTYAAAGTYTVTLTASNAAGSSQISHTITVQTGTVIGGGTPNPEALDVLVEIGVPPGIAETDAWAWKLDGTGALSALDTGGTLPDRYVYIPVTDDVVSIEIERGRSRELDRTDNGTASIVLRDDNPLTARQYDGGNWLSRLFPYVGPRARVRVTVDGQTIFGGDVSSTPVQDTLGNQVVTTFQAVEIGARLNRKVAYFAEGKHTAGRRIARLLETAGWEDNSYLFTGVSQYGGGYDEAHGGVWYEGTAWDLIQDVAISEGGMAYISNVGNSLNFIDRDHMHGPNTTSMETLSDLPTVDLQYDDVTRDAGMDNVANFITLKSAVHDVTVTARDELSIGELGEIPFEATLPIGGDNGTATRWLLQYRADQLLADYARPKTRFNTVTIQAAKLAKNTRRPFVLGQEVGHCVTVERHPPGSGWPPTLSQLCIIIGIKHVLEPKLCTTTFTLTPQL